ncbi:MAG: helix-turn-helix transcriptional regulator [Caulobacteraceae bacterium]|nr:helix-turn-helix transcriptional regulator [Caulobacteraceae bacterium]
MSKSILQTVAIAVRSRRTALAISQEELGERSGLHRTYIGGIERAERNLTLGALEKIANALGCAVSDLVKPT